MVMSRTSSRVYGYLMKMNMYPFFVHSNISPRVIRKPFYSSVSKVFGINVDEFA